MTENRLFLDVYITVLQNGPATDALVPTVSDLTGFWEMVLLQVVDIDKLFAEIDQLRANNWIAAPDSVDGAVCWNTY